MNRSGGWRKLKWALGFPLGVSAFGQPSVAAGRVFGGSDIGYMYSLDMRTGCVYWSYQTKAAVRTASTIGQTGAANHLDTPFMSATCRPASTRSTPRRAL